MARYALIIGISQYKSPLGNLDKTTTDAEAVAQILEERGDFEKVIRLPSRLNPEKNVYEMVPKGVTGAELGQALKTFLLERADKSEALIYFTGHGITVSDHLGQQKGYLATSDCAIEVQGKNTIVEQQHAIALDSLNDLIRASNLSSLVLLLDCCHGGYFLERSLVEQTLTAFSSQKDYYLITACRGFEKAWAIKAEQHDVFTGALLRGLAPENAGKDGRISGDRLFDYISEELKGSRQEPIRMGWGRSIKLITYPPQQLPASVTPHLFRQDNPYLGLNAFALEQADYFCGREQIVRVLLDHLAKSRFLAVIGPSGCGKSSLVKAGLFPQFQRDRLPGSSQWEIEAFTPGNHPIERLLKTLNRQQQRSEPFVLFIDQFEELFTLCGDETERRSFIRLMAQEATNSERPTRVIVAIRGDFLDRCAAYPEAAGLINQTQPNLVTPLTLFELTEAIERPASLHGVNFEPGLVSQIANDVVDRPGALPLLQYALTELWRVCIEEVESPQPCLTWQGYREIGGVKGALEKRADLLYLSFVPEDQAFVRRLFLELVQIGEGQEFTRRRASWDDLRAIADSPQQLEEVTRLLAGQQQRLIITDEKTVEVAHEALLSEWKLLKSWIEENRENIRLSRRLEAECREWRDTYQKSEAALITGAPLATFVEWREKTNYDISPLAEEFLNKSIERRDRELQTQLEQERRLREEAEARAEAEAARAKESGARAKAEAQKAKWSMTAGGLLVVLIITAFGFQLKAQQRENQIQSSKAIATASLILRARQLLETGNQLEALTASVQALRRIEELGAGNAQALASIQSIVMEVQERNRFKAHNEAVTSISFGPDGEILASASTDGTLKLWSIQGDFLKLFPGHTEEVINLKFSPKGNIVAAASLDGTIKLWDVISGKALPALLGHKNGAYSVSFSPDGKKLASSSEDGSIRLWNVNDIEEDKNTRVNRQISLLQEPQRILSIDFSPNGEDVIFTSRDNYSVKIWNTEKNLKKVIGYHKNALSNVSFSPNGLIAASSDYGGTIKLWSVRNGYKEIGSINSNHQGYLHSIAFSPDSKIIASSGEDGTIRTFDVASQKRIQVITGHKNDVNQVIFNPRNSQEIFSASDDATIRAWKIRKTQSSIYTQNPGTKALLLYSCDALKFYNNCEQMSFE